MYYYIFEPAQNKRELNQQEDIKAILQKHQVAGEFVTLSLAEKPQDLARIGLRRGFTTIVAVGGDSLINEVACGLVNSDYALGVIPTNPKSPFLKMINARDYEEACLALPTRRIAKIDTVLVNDKFCMITQARIGFEKDRSELIQVNFDNYYRTEVRLPEIIISNIGVKKKPELIQRALSDNLVDIYIPAKSKIRAGIFSIFSSLQKESSKTGSIFHVKKGQITARKPIKMTIDNQEVATQPFEVKAVPKSLNIIIKRLRAKSLEKEPKTW